MLKINIQLFGGRGSNSGISTGFNMSRFRDNVNTYIGGGYTVQDIFSRAELNYMKQNSTYTDSPLYRVEDMGWMADKLKVGSKFNFDMPMKSFTRDAKAVTTLLRDADDYGLYDTPVVFKTVGKTAHFNVTPYGNSHYKYQQESMVSGKGWKVKRISTEKIGGRKLKVIYIGR